MKGYRIPLERSRVRIPPGPLEEQQGIGNREWGIAGRRDGSDSFGYRTQPRTSDPGTELDAHPSAPIRSARKHVNPARVGRTASVIAPNNPRNQRPGGRADPLSARAGTLNDGAASGVHPSPYLVRSGGPKVEGYLVTHRVRILTGARSTMVRPSGSISSGYRRKRPPDQGSTGRNTGRGPTSGGPATPPRRRVAIAGLSNPLRL